MRFFCFCLLFLSAGCFAVYAQQDTVAPKENAIPNLSNTQLPDSAAIAKTSKENFMADSIARVYLMPDSLAMKEFINTIKSSNIFNTGSISSAPLKQKASLTSGLVRTSRDPWIIIVIICLLIYTAFLNLFLSNDIKNVIQSFYNKQSFSQLDKEGGLVNSWASIGLFLLFCLALGLVLYQLTVYYQRVYPISGFQLFISLSLIISLLLAFKFIILKFVGLVFDASRLVSEYIAILNLTYFNIAFVLLFVALCFSLLAAQFIGGLLVFTLIAIAVIFAWQYLRSSVNIISNFRFHKFYLFIYLCALEICPILILIKTLNI
jgi:hypothetical protein